MGVVSWCPDHPGGRYALRVLGLEVAVVLVAGRELENRELLPGAEGSWKKRGSKPARRALRFHPPLQLWNSGTLGQLTALLTCKMGSEPAISTG